MSAGVSVIIAAKDAALTIGQAVGSALAEPEVARVIVADDGSSDGTGAVASRVGADSGRVEVLTLGRSFGPAYARNRAIEQSRDPFIAILDADDFFLPGRFSRLFATTGWDLAADNIAFFPEGVEAATASRSVASFDARPATLDLEAFVRGNIACSGLQRGELGFLKPVMRREFLVEHGLRYDEALRLGEDYDLYTRILAHGGRFVVLRNCGYGATVRGASLSGRHSTEDLRRFADVDIALLSRPGLSSKERDAIMSHERDTRDRFQLRRYLDMRRSDGMVKTLARLVADPPAWRPVFGGALSDKLWRLRPTTRPAFEAVVPRYLFPHES